MQFKRKSTNLLTKLNKFLDIIEVQAQHLSDCPCSISKTCIQNKRFAPSYWSNQWISKSFIVKYRQLIKFIDDHLVQMLGLQIDISDQTYKICLIDGNTIYQW